MRKAVLMFVMAFPANAGEANFVFPYVKEINYGLACDLGPGTTEGGHNTIDGEVISRSEVPEFNVKTRIIPAEIPRTFGAIVQVSAPPASGLYMASVTHPPMGPRKRTTQSWPTLQSYGLAIVGYTFEDQFELVPGTWTFRLSDGDLVVYQQSYEVVRSHDVTTAGSVCKDAPQS